jgi:hypothetical protein
MTTNGVAPGLTSVQTHPVFAPVALISFFLSNLIDNDSHLD